MQSDWVTPDDNTDVFSIFSHNSEICRLHTNGTHSPDCSLGLLFICMNKNWNASIRCVNNFPPTMTEATRYAASVTAKTYSNSMCSRNVGARYLHIKDDVSWGIWKCQGRGWHVCLSANRHVAQVTEDCQLGAMFKRKNHIWAKLCHFDWLGIIKAEDAGKKLFAF